MVLHGSWHLGLLTTLCYKFLVWHWNTGIQEGVGACVEVWVVFVTAVRHLWGQQTNDCRDKSVSDMLYFIIARVDCRVRVMAAAEAGWGGGAVRSCHNNGVTPMVLSVTRLIHLQTWLTMALKIKEFCGKLGLYICRREEKTYLGGTSSLISSGPENNSSTLLQGFILLNSYLDLLNSCHGGYWTLFRFELLACYH